MAKMMFSEKDFFNELEKDFGKDKNENHIKRIKEYLDRFVNPNKLFDVLWYIELYYKDKTHPPITGDIDYCIHKGIEDKRGNDPYKPYVDATHYNYNVLDEMGTVSDKEKDEVARLAAELKEKLLTKQKETKTLFSEEEMAPEKRHQDGNAGRTALEVAISEDNNNDDFDVF